jgi:hypothetical protein
MRSVRDGSTPTPRAPKHPEGQLNGRWGDRVHHGRRGPGPRRSRGRAARSLQAPARRHAPDVVGGHRNKRKPPQGYLFGLGYDDTRQCSLCRLNQSVRPVWPGAIPSRMSVSPDVAKRQRGFTSGTPAARQIVVHERRAVHQFDRVRRRVCDHRPVVAACGCNRERQLRPNSGPARGRTASRITAARRGEHDGLSARAIVATRARSIRVVLNRADRRRLSRQIVTAICHRLLTTE